MTASARIARLGAMGLVAVAALAGCVADDPEPTRSAPAPSDAAEEQTDEELLAEAREVYEGYLAAGEEMARTNAYDIGLLTPWAAREIAEVDAAQIADIEENGIAITGVPGILSFNLAGVSDGVASVDACLDTSSRQYFDSSGVEVFITDGEPIVALDLAFSTADEGDLLLTRQVADTSSEGTPCI